MEHKSLGKTPRNKKQNSRNMVRIIKYVTSVASGQDLDKTSLKDNKSSSRKMLPVAFPKAELNLEKYQRHISIKEMRKIISNSYENKFCKIKIDPHSSLKSHRSEDKSRFLSSGNLIRGPDLKEILKQQKENSNPKFSKDSGSIKCSHSSATSDRSNHLSLERKSLNWKLSTEVTTPEIILPKEDRFSKRKILKSKVLDKPSSMKLPNSENSSKKITLKDQYGSASKCSQSLTHQRHSEKKESLSSPINSKRNRPKPAKIQSFKKTKHNIQIINEETSSCVRKKKLHFEERSKKQVEPALSTSCPNENSKNDRFHEIACSKYSFTALPNADNKLSLDEVKDENVSTIYPTEQRMDIDETEFGDCFEKSSSNNCIKQDAIVVVDTNVLLKGRPVIDELRCSMFYGKTMKIIIPFMVLQELDKLKTSQVKEIEQEAQAAIRWCNTYLENDDPCIQGQNYNLYIQSLNLGGKSGDDAILGCCLLFCKNGKIVYLVSNDINLRNKALSFKIRSISSKKLQDLMHQKDRVSTSSSVKAFTKDSDDFIAHKIPLSSDPEFSKWASSLSLNHVDYFSEIAQTDNFDVENSIVKCLGGILEYVMKDAYEDLWESIVLYKPPWSAVQVLKCFEKHWVAVFTDKFSYDIKEEIKEIRQALENHKKLDIHEKLHFLYGLFTDEPYKSIVSAPTNTKSQLNEVRTVLPVTGLLEIQNCILEGHSFTNFDYIKQVIIDVGRHASFILKEMTDSLKNAPCDAIGIFFFEIGRSLKVLRTTLVSFGYLLLRLKDGSDKATVASLNQQLNYYWELAQQKRPFVSFPENQLSSFSASVEGSVFLQLCLADFEKLIQSIDSLLEEFKFQSANVF